MNRQAPAMNRQVLPPPLALLRRAVQRRTAVITIAMYLPPAAAAIIAAHRWLGVGGAAALGVPLAIVGMLLLRRTLRRHDIRWLSRRLNAALPAFEDSIELVMPPSSAIENAAARRAATAAGLAALQRARLMQRLAELPLPDLRPTVPRAALGAAWGLAAVLLAIALLGGALWRQLPRMPSPAARDTGGATVSSVTLRMAPPGYTGLPEQEFSSWDVKVPEGSRLSFVLGFDREPTTAALLFLDGTRVELRRDGAQWRGERVLEKSALYRLRLNSRPDRADPAPPAGDDPLRRIDVIPDRPPEILVRAPDRTLNLLVAGQKQWDLVFEASDDYGIVSAQLSIALAQGSGENIKTTQRTLELAGSGDARHRVYRKTLDLAGLGFAEGDDLVVRLTVTDNRPVTPNRGQSASFILRWPAPAVAQSEGMEVLAQKTMPAYFTSERQLIIDSEALLAARDAMAAERYARRSDELGVEQKRLRLRYGEFLGEESERSAQHDDDAPSTAKPAEFGAAGTITSEYGHMHDKPEAATLLDPDTRRILKAALDEMWQAELNLRIAKPDAALPFEYRALGYIKQVQEAERIYLARAGVQLPQADPSRRLSGDRGGLSDREDATSAAIAEDSPVAAAWERLSKGVAPEWPPLEAWVRAHQGSMADGLGLLAAADRLRRDPDCTECRARLEGLLWPLLPPPAGAVEPRRAADAAQAAYLQALAGPGPAAGP